MAARALALGPCSWLCKRQRAAGYMEPGAALPTSGGCLPVCAEPDPRHRSSSSLLTFYSEHASSCRSVTSSCRIDMYRDWFSTGHETFYPPLISYRTATSSARYLRYFQEEPPL